MWWIIATLVLTGILLMLVEMLLTPGVGVAGLLSLGSFGTAVWYSFNKFGYTAGWISLVVVTVILVLMLVVILRSGTWKRLSLRTEIDSKVNTESEQVKAGDRGVCVTRLAPLGTARFGGLSCEVKSFDNSMLAAGTEVEVVCVEDNRIEVKPITE